MSTPDYPAALWVPAHPTNYHNAGRATFERVVIHCTDGHDKAGPVADMWAQPNHFSSAHFVIGQDGLIIQSVSLSDIAWHAHKANQFSVGLEHCARTPGELGKQDPGLPPSEVQLDASARLAAWLCRIADLPANRETIQGHAEIDPKTTHRLCPMGCGLDLDDYVERVVGVLASTPAPFA